MPLKTNLSKFEIKPVGVELSEEICSIWEASVRASHHFLKEEDILLYRRFVSEAMPVTAVHGLFSGHDLCAFLVVEDYKIEMLFVSPEYMGCGAGSRLIDFAIGTLKARFVDVNEQNEKAYGFYLSKGFRIISRDETDPLGKPYPIIHMELERTLAI